MSEVCCCNICICTESATIVETFHGNVHMGFGKKNGVLSSQEKRGKKNMQAKDGESARNAERERKKKKEIAL